MYMYMCHRARCTHCAVCLPAQVGVDLSERDVNLCFSWSRMCVVEVHHNKGKVRDRELPHHASRHFRIMPHAT